jgi:hypothetical protein
VPDPAADAEVADADSLWVNRRIVRNTVAVNDGAGMPVGLELTASRGPMHHDLAARGIVLRRGGETHWQPSCQAKQSQCQRAHSMKSAIAKLAVFIGADSRFDLR